MTGKWTALERRFTSTSVTLVDVLTHGDLPQCFCWCPQPWLLSLLSLSHRLPPASPPHTPEPLKVITEPVPKLILQVSLEYFNYFLTVWLKMVLDPHLRGQRERIRLFILPAGGSSSQISQNKHKSNYLHSREIARVLKFSGPFKLEISKSFLTCWQEYKPTISNRAVFNPTSLTVDRSEDTPTFVCFCGSCYYEHLENLVNLTALPLSISACVEKYIAKRVRLQCKRGKCCCQIQNCLWAQQKFRMFASFS